MEESAELDPQVFSLGDGKMKKLLGLLAAAIGLTAIAGPAQAVTVTQNGADYTVYVNSTANSLIWRFYYVADFNGFTNSTAQAAITGINFKVEGADATAATLISAPTANSQWTTAVDENLNGSALGCDPSPGNNNMVCSGITLAANQFNLPTNTNATYMWVVDVTFTSALTAAMITNVDNPIRAQFVRTGTGGDGLVYTQMSLNGPFVCCRRPPDVPEPGTLALLGFGLLGLGMSRRRKA